MALIFFLSSLDVSPDFSERFLLPLLSSLEALRLVLPWTYRPASSSPAHHARPHTRLPTAGRFRTESHRSVPKQTSRRRQPDREFRGSPGSSLEKTDFAITNRAPVVSGGGSRSAEGCGDYFERKIFHDLWIICRSLRVQDGKMCRPFPERCSPAQRRSLPRCPTSRQRKKRCGD